MKCPLCGFEFAREEMNGVCKGCPLNKDCRLTCCPNCHYQFVDESKTIGFVGKLFKRRKER